MFKCCVEIEGWFYFLWWDLYGVYTDYWGLSREFKCIVIFCIYGVTACYLNGKEKNMKKY